MATWEKSEVFGIELLRNSQLPSFPARHWSESKLRHGRQRRSLPRETTWKLTVQTEKRPGPPVATHNSEETAAVEKSRKDVETVTWKPHSQVNVIRTAQTNRTDDSDILHAHWQDTAEQFFLSKFEMHYVRFAMIKKGRSIFTRLDYLASSVGCFVSVSFIRSFFACHAFCSPPFVLSFFFFAYWIEPVNRGQW